MMLTEQRKLVTLRQIRDLKAIEGADAIELALVDGWKTIIKKNQFSKGDFCVYFEIDSFLPVKDTYEFLRKSCFRSTKHLGDGFRIKTIKLRGEISQGLVLPISDFDIYKESDTTFKYTDPNSGNQYYIIPNETDLTELFDVKKYEQAIPANLSGKVRGSFPSFIPKTDQQRIQNIFYSSKFQRNKDSLFEITLKLDGTSFTAFCNKGDVGVCSRTLSLKLNEENSENSYVKLAKESKLLDTLKAFYEKTGRSLAVQGELMGPGIQANREQLKEHTLFIFDVFDIDAGSYLTPADRENFVKFEIFPNVLPEKVKHVPVLEYRNFSDVESIEEALKLAEIKSLNHPVAEGIVCKSVGGDYSFKIINNQFLLKDKND